MFKPMQLAVLLIDGALLLLFAGGCVLVVQSLRCHNQLASGPVGISILRRAAEIKPRVPETETLTEAPAAAVPASIASWEPAVVGSEARDKNRLASSVSAAVVKSRRTNAAAPAVPT